MFNEDLLREKFEFAKENNVSLSFSTESLSVSISGEDYPRIIEITDNYSSTEREYNITYRHSIEDVVETEQDIVEKINLAKQIETQEEVNHWVQSDTEVNEFLKFVNGEKQIYLCLTDSDKWSVNGSIFQSIKQAKYELASCLLTRNPIQEQLNDVAQQTLKEHLKEVDLIGDTVSSRMAQKARNTCNGIMESQSDVTIHPLENVDYRTKGNAEDYLDNLNFDPIEEAVTEERHRLVKEYDQTHIVSEAI